MAEAREQVDALDHVALTEVRKAHDSLGWSLRKTADSLAGNGWHVSTMAAQRLLDSSRAKSARQTLTVGEWLHLAYTFAVPPIALIAPTDQGRFRVGRDRRVSAAALESWIVGASPLPRMADGTTANIAAMTTRYLDVARSRSRRGSEFGDYLRRMADAFDRADNVGREGIVLDMLQHMAGVGLDQARRKGRSS